MAALHQVQGVHLMLARHAGSAKTSLHLWLGTQTLSLGAGGHAYQLVIASETSGNKPGMDVLLWGREALKGNGTWYRSYRSLMDRSRQRKPQVQRRSVHGDQKCEETLWCREWLGHTGGGVWSSKGEAR